MQKTEAHAIVLKPVLTEKSTWEQENRNLYRFEVAGGANKVEIKRAVELLFDVDVLQVNTLIRPGKLRRRGARYHQTPPRKIALVRLAEDQKIELL